MECNNLKKFYYKSENGIDDEFVKLLDCYDKMLYFSMKDDFPEKCFYFLNDINLSVSKKNNEYLIGLNKFPTNADFFSINRKKFESIDIKNGLLDELIDCNQKIGLRTCFNLIPDYGWYWENCKETKNRHYCLCVGYDAEYYYIVEDPYVVKEEVAVKYKENSSIILVNKNNINQALNSYCEIMLIEEKEKKIDYYKILQNYIQKIIVNYFEVTRTNEEGEVKIGRNAIESLGLVIGNNDMISLYSQILEDTFFIHMMYSVRVILRLCLQYNEKNYNKYLMDETMKYLKISINTWNNFNKVIFLRKTKGKKAVDKIMNTYIPAILLNEDRLVMSLKQLIK